MNTDRTFNIHTLGCKLNFSESSEIARRLTDAGFLRKDEAYHIIVNSCAVTEAAVKKTRNLVARLHRENPASQIILVGCYAALEPLMIQQWEGVSAVFGSEDKSHVVPFLCGDPVPHAPLFSPAFSSGDRTRSFLKIQDGCDYHCSYCTVALARGRSRSASIEEVMQQLYRISASGIKEVNLTGVNIGDFGTSDGTSLLDLLCEIERQRPVDRIRISSIEPNLLKKEIIQLILDSSVMMPHFHIPLQSGSDSTLSKMKRRYTRNLFREKVIQIKSLMPDACIAIDVISGFPTETDQDFTDSYRFIEDLPISYLHVFTYSRRPNTPAASMPQVPDMLKKERTQQLLALSDKKKRDFYRQFEGTIRPVLFESDHNDGMMYGFTDNYLKVNVPYDPGKINKILPVLLNREIFIIDN